jgi:hypothetical protein
MAEQPRNEDLSLRYLGHTDGFAQALAEFAEAHADLTERDHAAQATEPLPVESRNLR